MNEQSFVALLCTTGSMEEAKRIGSHLVENHLAACVNVIPGLHSIYRWQNKVATDSEFLMIIKTEAGRIPEIESAVRSLHSYENPELIALNITYGLPDYLQWLENSLVADET